MAGFAPNFSTLLTARLIQGAATGLALPLMFNIILTQAPKAKIGTFMGVASMIVAMAPAIGPVLGGFVVDQYGWQVIFFLLLPLLTIALICGAIAIKPTNELKPARFNLSEYLLLVVAFSSFIFATEKAASHGWLSAMVLGLFSVSLAALTLFYTKTKERTDALIQVETFKNRPFMLSLAFILITQFCVLALGFLLPNYAQLAHGSSAFLSGFLLLPGCIVGAFIAPISGRMLDNLGAKKPILIGAGFILLSLVLFTLCEAWLSTAVIMLLYVIFTLGQGFAVGNTMTNGLRQLPTTLSADGNAIINTLQQLAGAVGTSVVSTVVASAQSGTESLEKATALGTQYAFGLLVCLAVIGMICVWNVFVKKAEK